MTRYECDRLNRVALTSNKWLNSLHVELRLNSHTNNLPVNLWSCHVQTTGMVYTVSVIGAPHPQKNKSLHCNVEVEMFRLTETGLTRVDRPTE